MALFFIVLCSMVQAQVYVPDDAKSKINFKIKNFGSSVEGSFKGLKGTLNFDPSNLSNARFDVTINAATIDTGISMRDNHLRKRDYFNVTDFPTIRFVSGSIAKTGKLNEAVVSGKLTIKNTTKEISIPFLYAESTGVFHFTGEFKINRKDFNVGGSSFSLSDELIILLDVITAK